MQSGYDGKIKTQTAGNMEAPCKEEKGNCIQDKKNCDENVQSSLNEKAIQDIIEDLVSVVNEKDSLNEQKENVLKQLKEYEAEKVLIRKYIELNMGAESPIPNIMELFKLLLLAVTIMIAYLTMMLSVVDTGNKVTINTVYCVVLSIAIVVAILAIVAYTFSRCTVSNNNKRMRKLKLIYAIMAISQD